MHKNEFIRATCGVLFALLLSLCLGNTAFINRIMYTPAAGGNHTDYTSQFYAYWYLEESSSPSDNEGGNATYDWTWGATPLQITDNVQGTYALDFNATDTDRAYFASSVGYPGNGYTGDWTILCWIKVTDQTADRGIYTFGQWLNDQAYALYYQNSSDDFVYTWTEASATQSLTSTLDIGTGYYFVGIQHDNTASYYRLYVGDASTAVQVTSVNDATAHDTTTGNVFWGVSHGGSGYYYHQGRLDACAAAKVAFTEAQINEMRQYGYDGQGW